MTIRERDEAYVFGLLNSFNPDEVVKGFEWVLANCCNVAYGYFVSYKHPQEARVKYSHREKPNALIEAFRDLVQNTHWRTEAEARKRKYFTPNAGIRFDVEQSERIFDVEVYYDFPVAAQLGIYWNWTEKYTRLHTTANVQLHLPPLPKP